MATRERRPSTTAPVAELSGPIGPPGMSRPKHKRTVTGLGPSDIKRAEAEIPDTQKAAWKKFSAREFKTKEEFEVHKRTALPKDIQLTAIG